LTALLAILATFSFHCACTETALYELPVKILTSPFDSLTPMAQYLGDLRTFSVDFCIG